MLDVAEPTDPGVIDHNVEPAECFHHHIHGEMPTTAE